jgi:acetyl esterase
MVWFWDNYTTDAEARKQIYASPLQATPEQLKGLPPTLIQTAEFDVLRDEAEAYGRKLDAAGVQVKSVRYNGMIHDFGLSNAFNRLPAVQSAIAQASQELKTHLSQDVQRRRRWPTGRRPDSKPLRWDRQGFPTLS